VLRDVPSATLERLAALSEPLSLRTDEPLPTSGGDEDHDVYLVANGRLLVFRATNPAGEVRLGEIGPGGLFGEFAAITGRAGSAVARAAVPSVIVRVPREGFLELIREHPQVALRLLDHLIGLVRALEERVAALKSLDRALERLSIGFSSRPCSSRIEARAGAGQLLAPPHCP
jgi:CRP-like cAMP-binding protein